MFLQREYRTLCSLRSTEQLLDIQDSGPAELCQAPYQIPISNSCLDRDFDRFNTIPLAAELRQDPLSPESDPDHPDGCCELAHSPAGVLSWASRGPKGTQLDRRQACATFRRGSTTDTGLAALSDSTLPLLLSRLRRLGGRRPYHAWQVDRLYTDPIQLESLTHYPLWRLSVRPIRQAYATMLRAVSTTTALPLVRNLRRWRPASSTSEKNWRLPCWRRNRLIRSTPVP